MIYREKAAVRIDDFDSLGRLKPAALLKLFENAAGRHSELAMDSISDARAEGVAWILTEWRVEALRTPTLKDELYIETWATTPAPVTRTKRELLVKAADNEELVRAEAQFALYDLGKKRVTAIDAELISRYQPEDKYLFSDELPRFSMPDEYNAEATLTVRRSDVDYNGHVHNTAYLDFAAELLPQGMETFRRLRIVYRRQLMRGDEVTLRGCEQDGVWRVGIYFGGKLSAGVDME